jgi:hypothetical protein
MAPDFNTLPHTTNPNLLAKPNQSSKSFFPDMNLELRTLDLITIFVYLGLGTKGIVNTFGIHAYWVGLLVNLVFLSVAYLCCRIFREPPSQDQLAGLTVWTKVK